MRRFSLGKQITVVFFLAFALTNLIIALQTTGTLKNAYLSQMYDSLDAEAKAVRMADGKEAYQPAAHTAFIRYALKDGTHTASENIHAYADDASIELLAGVARAQEDTIGHYVNTIGDTTIYYVIHRFQGFFRVHPGDTVIVLTDTALINHMIRPSVELLIACLIAFAIGFLVVFLWSRRLVKNILGIRDDITRLGRDHYRTKISTARRDELGDLVDNIEAMRRQIILREQSRQELWQGISHDLKTPVNIIQSYAEALQDGMCDADTAAEVTLKQANRLSDKVNKLLDLTRLGYLDTGHMPLGKVPMDDLVGELAANYAYRRDIEFALDLAPVSFDGDPESWRIAIENILDNALRYAKSRIVVTLRPDHLAIFNDGKGIEDIYLSRIFLPYEKSRDGRFGLGLAIVQKTVVLFGYGIRAENVADGVRFTIYR